MKLYWRTVGTAPHSLDLALDGGQDNLVGISTRHRLDGPGIETHCGDDFLHLSRPALGSTQPSVSWTPSLFFGGKAAGTWRWLPTPSSTEVKERVQLYLYFPSGSSWPVLRWTSSFTSRR